MEKNKNNNNNSSNSLVFGQWPQTKRVFENYHLAQVGGSLSLALFWATLFLPKDVERLTPFLENDDSTDYNLQVGSLISKA